MSVPSDKPFAADGGITLVPAATGRDPFEAFDDLMTVIEALCPVWPSREIFSSTDRFLILRFSVGRLRDGGGRQCNLAHESQI